MQRTRVFDKSRIVKRAGRPCGGLCGCPPRSLSVRERRFERLSCGELMKDGKYLDAMEQALYTKLLDKLDSDAWDDCGQVVKLLEGLSII